VKIATWNVNGIRARFDEVHAFITRERPDVVCLQELKASAEQIPILLLEAEGYWCYMHGDRAYSGVALLVNKELAPTRPAFSHPSFDHESRIVTVKLGDLTVASIYVPNGGKDYPAKIRFLEAMAGYAAGFQAAGAPLVMCGDFNVARTDMDVHPSERKREAIGQRAEERELIERRRDPADRRRHLVKLTPAGKKTLSKLRALQASIDADFLEPLDAEERATLHTLLHRLATHHDPRFGNGH